MSTSSFFVMKESELSLGNAAYLDLMESMAEYAEFAPELL